MKLRSVGLMAVLALVVVSCGGAASEDSGPSEGIQVHGDWTIDVYNEDGSLDRHTEFSNALVDTGAEHLVQVLGGVRSTSGDWFLLIKDQGAESLCLPDPDCLFNVGSAQFIDNGSGHVLRLAASGSVSIDGEVDSVESSTGYCGPTVAPADCGNNQFPLVTFKLLDSPIPVSAGQTVDVQMDLSFTSG